MKSLEVLVSLLAMASAAIAAPTNYNSLAPSERALIDATSLICGQYPARSWVLIGTLKVECGETSIEKREAEAHIEEEKREMTNTIDADWYVEYRIAE